MRHRQGARSHRATMVLFASAMAVAATVAVSPSSGAAPGPRAPMAWVTTHGLSSDPGDTVVPVDLARRRAGTPVTTASEPAAVAAAPGGRLLVADRGKDLLSVVDTLTHRVVATVRVGLEPDAVAVAPGAGGHGIALVADFGDDELTPVNLATLRAAPPVSVGQEPVAVAVAPAAGGRAPTALVADFGDGDVTPIDLATMQPGAAVPVGSEPDAVAVVARGPSGGPEAVVGDFGTDDVVPVDLATMSPGTPVPLGADPTGLAVARDGTTWVVAGASLVRLAPGSLVPEASIALPDVGEAIALRDGTTAWVAEQNGTLVGVTLGSRLVGKAVEVGGRPSAVAITPS